MNKFPHFLVAFLFFVASSFGQTEAAGCPDKTITNLNIEIALGPEKANLLLERAGRYRKAGIESSYKRDIDRALKLEPDNDSILVAATKLLMDESASINCEQVLKITSAYISRHTKSDMAYGSRAKGKICSGDMVGAFDDLAIAIELNPDERAYEQDWSNIPYRMADSHKSIELHKKIIDYYTSRAATEPQSHWPGRFKSSLASAYVGRSFTYKKIGDKNSQFSDLTTAVELWPEQYLRFRVNAYDELKMYDEAIADLTRYIALLENGLTRSPREPWGMYEYRAGLYVSAGKYDEAIADYKKALELFPTHKTWIEAQIAAAKQRQFESQRPPQKR